jgi:transcriptional regulator with GAF, ATPase, and Fis domain
MVSGACLMRTCGRLARGQERQAILEALRQAHGKVYGANGAATKLGLKPTTLYGKMRKHGIRKTATAE